MINYDTALSAASAITEMLRGGMAAPGRSFSIEYSIHILPILEEHYIIPNASRGLLSLTLMSQIVDELECASKALNTELGQTVVTLRLTGIVLLCEKKLELKVQELMHT